MGRRGGHTIRLGAVSAANVGAGAALQFLGILSLGAGAATDAYFAALTVPTILAAILIPAVTNNLTPQLSGLDEDKQQALAKFVLLKSAVPLLLAFAVLALSAAWWLPMLFRGLDASATRQAVGLSPVLSVVFCINVMLAAGNAAHHAAGRLTFTESVQATASAVALLLVIPTTERYGTEGLAGLLLARAMVNFLVLCGPCLAARATDMNGHAKIFWMRSGELIGGSVLFKLGPVVDRVLASYLAPGVMTAFGLGQQVAGSAGSLTDRVFSRPLLVQAGRHLAGEDPRSVRVAYLAQSRAVAMVVGMAGGLGVTVAALLAWAWPAGFGAVLSSMGRADVVVALALVAVPTAFGQLSASLLYAKGDVRRLSWLATGSFLVSTACKIVGFFLVGTYAIVFGAFLYQVLNWMLFHREAKRFLESEAP